MTDSDLTRLDRLESQSACILREAMDHAGAGAAERLCADGCM